MKSIGRCHSHISNVMFTPEHYDSIWQSHRLRNAGNSYDGYNKGNIYWIGRLCCQQYTKSGMQWGERTVVFDLYGNYDAMAFFFSRCLGSHCCCLPSSELLHLRYLGSFWPCIFIQLPFSRSLPALFLFLSLCILIVLLLILPFSLIYTWFILPMNTIGPICQRIKHIKPN